MAVRHRRADLDAALEVFIKTTVTGSAAATAFASGVTLQDADITYTNNGTGDYTVTINPLKRPPAEAFAFVTPVSAASKLFVTVKSIAYTGESLAIEVLFFTDAGTATDPDSFFLHVFGS